MAIVTVKQVRKEGLKGINQGLKETSLAFSHQLS